MWNIGIMYEFYCEITLHIWIGTLILSLLFHIWKHLELDIGNLTYEILISYMHNVWHNISHIYMIWHLRLVPYHGKCKRIQPRIEFIYIYIYIYVWYTVLFCYGVWRLGIGNTEESNNKNTESSRTENSSKAMRKRL